MRIHYIQMTLLMGLVAAGHCVQTQTPSNPPTDLKILVQAATDKAVKEAEQEDVYYRFRMRKETHTYKLDRELVETKDGFVARTLLWQDHELTPEERINDDNKLDRLLTDSDERLRIFKRQQEESQRILRMVKALPVAAIYEFDGFETINKRKTCRLKFKPNSKFNPDSRETLVFKSAEGHLWIDVETQTIAKLEGILIDDINIGWGILGHVDKGGTITLEQSEVSPGHWRITKLIIEAKGRMLLFKFIEVWQHQFSSDYKLLSKEPTLQEGINMLRSTNATDTSH